MSNYALLYSIVGGCTAAIVIVPIVLSELWNKITAYNNKSYKSNRWINWFMIQEQNVISLSIDMLFIFFWSLFALIITAFIWPFVLITIILLKVSPWIQIVINYISSMDIKFRDWLSKQNVKRLKVSSFEQK